MSLMERVERAQRAKAEAAGAEIGTASERPLAAPDVAPPDAGSPSIDGDPVVTQASVEAAPMDGSAPTDGAASTNGARTNDDLEASGWTEREPIAVMSTIPVRPADAPPSAGGLRAPRSPAREQLIQEVRLRLHGEVVSAFKVLLETKDGDVRKTIEPMVERVIERGGFAVTRDERMRLVEELVHDVTGFGPLEPFLADPTITEVMVNGPDHIYIERRGKIERVDTMFLNDQHVLRVIERIIAPLGRRIDESSPRVDARLPDGSRVNAVISPLSLVGPVITVRKFAQTPYTVDDLVSFGTATPDMFAFLRACI
ncbi:MAG: ATPase, T2SS/T4P/T4SS family, partial [Chloroflexota bacterium]|nr:ATPase, T2SS/T4P/T4SS family [Chloroflexota bacterium]